MSVSFFPKCLSFTHMRLSRSLFLSHSVCFQCYASASNNRRRRLGAIVMGSLVPPSCSKSLLLMSTTTTGLQFSGRGRQWKGKKLSPSNWQCLELLLIDQSQSKSKSKSTVMIIENQMVKPATYSSRISTDIPLYESPRASFDQYLEDKPRVFKAMFPDKQRSQRLNEVFPFSCKPLFSSPSVSVCVCVGGGGGGGGVWLIYVMINCSNEAMRLHLVLRCGCIMGFIHR
ncbi:hypothetical protein ACSBR2_010360 [Camellia fascicularis]